MTSASYGAVTLSASPTAAISPLRTTTVPLSMTAPVPVTIFAPWMAYDGGR